MSSKTVKSDIFFPINEYKLMDFQAELWYNTNNLLNKDAYKRFVYVWHRRAGKDLFGLHFLIYQALYGEVGTYWHVFPTYKQGKKAIWNETTGIKKILKDGSLGNNIKYLDFIPSEVIEKKNEHDLLIKLKNGSIYQIIGADNPDSLRGSGIKGVIFSEYAEMKPHAWDIVEPMIVKSKGFAGFNFTPKSKNHAYSLYRYAQESEKWHASKITVEDSKAIELEELEDIRKKAIAEGKETLFQQEYYCEFSNAVEGAYYKNEIDKMNREKRITDVPHDPRFGVYTFWDIGYTDATAIWFVQSINGKINIIDHHESNFKDIPYYINYVKDKAYTYTGHFLPHDSLHKDVKDGRTIFDQFYSLGITANVVPRPKKVMDGIYEVRALLNMCYIDKRKCKKGIEALENYKAKYNQDTNSYSNPIHDWASHSSDAIRYLAVSLDKINNDVYSSHKIDDSRNTYYTNYITF